MYFLDLNTKQVLKIYGKGPGSLDKKDVEKFYKFSSGAKSFNQLGVKEFTMTIDAVGLQPALWKKKRPGAVRELRR